MKTVGIIVEYNPLHNGHVLHYKKSKAIAQAERTVAVMSGNFLQRGEPALAGKRARTEMALSMGVDLVIELPAAYAVQPAEWFAYGAVSLLHATGVVDSLCFGSESGTLGELTPLAALLSAEDSPFKEELHQQLSLGLSYPAAYAAAAGAAQGSSPAEAAEITSLLGKPNNTLGLHYLMALRRLNSPIQAHTIPREAAQYHDPLPAGPTIASATSIRRIIREEGLEAAAPYMPRYTLDILSRETALGRGPVDWEAFKQPLFLLLQTLSTDGLSRMLEVSEGLEHRIKRLLPLLHQPSIEELISALKTKRYTRTKLQRMLLHILLQHSKEELSRERLAHGPGYIRVLGFSSRGQELLKAMKKSAALPVIMQASDLEHPQLELDVQATAAYAGAYPDPHTSWMYEDYLMPPLRF